MITSRLCGILSYGEDHNMLLEYKGSGVPGDQASTLYPVHCAPQGTRATQCPGNAEDDSGPDTYLLPRALSHWGLGGRVLLSRLLSGRRTSLLHVGPVRLQTAPACGSRGLMVVGLHVPVRMGGGGSRAYPKCTEFLVTQRIRGRRRGQEVAAIEGSTRSRLLQPLSGSLAPQGQSIPRAGGRDC